MKSKESAASIIPISNNDLGFYKPQRYSITEAQCFVQEVAHVSRKDSGDRKNTGKPKKEADCNSIGLYSNE